AGRRAVARDREQVPRALCRGRACEDPGPRLHHLLHSEAPARPVRAQGTRRGGMMGHLFLRALDRRALPLILAILALAMIVPALNLAVPPDHPLHVPTHAVTVFGKYLTYALLALALNLVWGYCGILSLGHAAFFALGGYAMGMYLMRQIGP